jgi:hypothetical protein
MSDATTQTGGSGAAAAPAATPKTPAADTPAAGAGSVIAIKVSFELDTMDGLRKVFFGLEKDVKGTDDIWTIHFQLQERTAATGAFVNVVTLDVLVDEPALHPAAAAAAANGLTPPQTAHAIGPAADDAKGTTTGDVDPSDANDTIKSTLKK